MKKILFILSILITSLSFAKPKDWIDENKIRKAGYEIFSGVPKYNIDNLKIKYYNWLGYRNISTKRITKKQSKTPLTAIDGVFILLN